MALSLNKVLLIGNVGKKPEIRTMQDGKEMAVFSLATGERWQDKKTKTEWHRVVVFQEGLVRVIKSYVSAGSKVCIEGHLRARKWTDDHNIERSVTEVVLQGYSAILMLLDSKPQTKTAQVEESGSEVYPLAPEEEKELEEMKQN